MSHAVSKLEQVKRLLLETEVGLTPTELVPQLGEFMGFQVEMYAECSHCYPSSLTS